MLNTPKTPYLGSSTCVQNPQWGFRHSALVESILLKNMFTSSRWNNTLPHGKWLVKYTPTPCAEYHSGYTISFPQLLRQMLEEQSLLAHYKWDNVREFGSDFSMVNVAVVGNLQVVTLKSYPFPHFHLCYDLSPHSYHSPTAPFFQFVRQTDHQMLVMILRWIGCASLLGFCLANYT